MAAYLAATLWPEAGRAIRAGEALAISLPVWLLAVLLFLAGIEVDWRQLRQAASHWKVLAGGMLLLWIVPSAMVATLGALPLPIPAGVLAGFTLVAAMPAAASSIGWTHFRGGNLAMSLALFTLSTLLSPLVIGLAARETSSTAAAPQLLLWIVPTVMAGVATRWVCGVHRVARVRPYLKLLGATVLLLLNYSNASLALPGVVAERQWQVLALCVAVAALLCGASFTAALVLARGSRSTGAEQHALCFAVGMKNTGLALVLSAVWLNEEPLATIAVIVATLVQHIAAAAYCRTEAVNES